MSNEVFKVDNLEPDYIQRLFSHINFDKISGCWLWLGNKNKTGYGRFRYKGPKVLVHRLMYSWVYGVGLAKKISNTNLILDHVCNNKNCCNPAHLRLTTHKVNVLRGNGPSAKCARKTHCKSGHLLEERRNPQGKRFCQPCNTVWARNRYRKVHRLSPDKFKV